MAKQTCVSKLENLEDLSDFELKRLEELEDVIHGIQETFRGDPAGKSNAIELALEAFTENTNRTAHNIIANEIKVKKVSNRVLSHVFEKVKEGKKVTIDDFNLAIKNAKDLFDGNNSIATRKNTKNNQYQRIFNHELEKTGHTTDWANNTFEEQVYEVNWNTSRGLSIDHLPPGAQKIREVLKKTNDVILSDGRAAGLDLSYREDHLFASGWSSEKILNSVPGEPEKAREHFINRAWEEGDLARDFPKIDPRTKEGEAHIRKVYGEWHDNLIESQSVTGIKLGKKKYRARGRIFNFKDGKSEYRFRKEFGAGDTLPETWNSYVDSVSNRYANTSMLGTEPEDAWNSLKQNIEKNFIGIVDKEKLTRGLDGAHSAYLDVSAPSNTVSSTSRRVVNLARAIQAFTKLGSSVFTALWDVNASALVYAMNSGDSMARGYMESIKESINVALNFNQRKELADVLGVNLYFNDTAILFGGNRGDFDTGWDQANRFFSWASKFTLVPHQTELSRLQNAIIQTKVFNKYIENSASGTLNKIQKMTLDTYNISKSDLDFLRLNAKRNKQFNAITSSDILDIPLEKFDSDPTIAMARKERLYNKFNSFLDDAIMKGTPTSDARVRRHLMKNRRKDELELFGVRSSDVANLVVQFKETAWKQALTNKEAYEKFLAAGGYTYVSKSLAEYLALAATSYAAIESARHAVLGTESPFEKARRGDKNALRDLGMDMFTRSNALPLLADSIEAFTSPHYGRDITNFLVGPSLGTINDLSKIKPTRKSVGRFIRSNIAPGNNILFKTLNNHTGEYDFWTNEPLKRRD